MRIFRTKQINENFNELDKKGMINYFDIILLSEKDDYFFDIYDSLVPKYLKAETPSEKDDYCLLKEKIVEFAKNENYFNLFDNGYCELTEKGKLAKKKGGHFRFERYLDKKEKSESKSLLVGVLNNSWLIMIISLLLTVIFNSDKIKNIINGFIDKL